MTRYDRLHTFFYFDPPYLETEGHGVPFEFGQYERIATVLGELRLYAILTLNDHAAFRDLFAGFQVGRVVLPYTVGGPANTVMRGELIIYSGTGRGTLRGSSDQVLTSADFRPATRTGLGFSGQ
ncbi:putative modification methylase [Burkholderia gladioli]|uniref:Modification methylase n=1 Tax=Burkholderia gladioli TaxID=28095 RepID=A0AAW3EWM1_BURGA|nr:putative modification methylase [Burkholderia gladioli]KGC11677.1 putative modification methylase [Burkholderia gladioli]